MEGASLIDLIPSLGFPIICTIALAWFGFDMVKRMATHMDSLQQRCIAREEALRNEIAENQTINRQFAEIIGRYDVKLDSICADIAEIKEHINDIKDDMEEKS